MANRIQLLSNWLCQQLKIFAMLCVGHQSHHWLYKILCLITHFSGEFQKSCGNVYQFEQLNDRNFLALTTYLADCICLTEWLKWSSKAKTVMLYNCMTISTHLKWRFPLGKMRFCSKETSTFLKFTEILEVLETLDVVQPIINAHWHLCGQFSLTLNSKHFTSASEWEILSLRIWQLWKYQFTYM